MTTTTGAAPMSAEEVLAVLQAAAWTLSERGCTIDEFDAARAAVSYLIADNAALRMRLHDIADSCRIVYGKVPALPLTTETMEAATHALHEFCLLVGVHNIDISDAAIDAAKAKAGDDQGGAA